MDRTGAQTMLYLACTTISSVDLAQFGVSLAKDWVSVKSGTRYKIFYYGFSVHIGAYTNAS